MCGILKVQSQKSSASAPEKSEYSIARKEEVVGTTGFEPATSRTPSVRATRLRYVPTAAARTEPDSRRPEERPHSITTSVSPAFEERQESAEGVAQIEEHFAAQEFAGVFIVGGDGSGFGTRGAIFAEMAASSGDGETFVVEQALNFEHQVDIFLAIHAMSGRTLDRLEHGEFAFPIAQDEGLEFGEAADFADAIELLLGGGLSRGAVVRHELTGTAGDNPSSLRGHAVEGVSWRAAA